MKKCHPKRKLKKKLSISDIHTQPTLLALTGTSSLVEHKIGDNEERITNTGLNILILKDQGDAYNRKGTNKEKRQKKNHQERKQENQTCSQEGKYIRTCRD